jgi:Ca2+-transporting ATPase
MPDFAAHAVNFDQVLKELKTSRHGLAENEAKARLERYGLNELKKKKGITPLQIFLSQFKNILVLILIGATIVSFAIGETLDAVVILIIVILNAVLGFVQEYKAERALEALKKFSSPTATVIRFGKLHKIDAKDIVPGDMVVISEGDRVPADIRLVESFSLKVNEASLTGESVPVAKVTDSLKENLGVADRKNMCFLGTNIVFGHGLGVAVNTGMRTEFGKIAELIQTAEERETPLQKSIGRFGRFIGALILVVIGAVFFLGIYKGIELATMFITAVSLAVAAIPEGLPAVVTITLAIGVQRMAKRNSIIRKLPAVETLGATTVICSDKTGTLTKNEMTVKEIRVDGRKIKITGEGYDPKGGFFIGKKEIDPEEYKTINLLFRVGVLCNNAKLENHSVIGDPTEGSLLVLAEKGGVKTELELNRYHLVHEFPFESVRKRMTTINKIEGKTVAHTKGAVESILSVCSKYHENGKIKTLTAAKKKLILKETDEMAWSALRVLAFAYKEVKAKKSYKISDVEDSMVFVGLVGMIDPPRPEAKAAILTCESAGIDIKMITGDHKATALAIAKEVGLMRHHGAVLTGEEISKLTDVQLEKVVNEIDVFARVSPEEKLRIVKALNNIGHVTAVTGDGVNDAPALKEADIGIAMGIIGTDVSKEAADMVLIDDNFATIVKAVEYGRNIYQNIIEFVMYLLSCNAGEVIAILLGILFLPFLPLTAIQILWVNLVTDGLPALALGMDPPEKGIMKRKPRKRNEPIMTRRRIFIMGFIGILIGLLTVLAFVQGLPEGLEKAKSMAFTALVMMELTIVFTSKSERPVFERGIFDNKFLILAVVSSFILQLIVLYVPFFHEIFDTYYLNAFDWFGILMMCGLLFAAVEVVKYGFAFIEDRKV